MKERLVKWIKIGTLPVLLLIVVGIHVLHFYKEAQLPDYIEELEEIYDHVEGDFGTTIDSYVMFAKSDNTICVVNENIDSPTKYITNDIAGEYLWCRSTRGEEWFIRNIINPVSVRNVPVLDEYKIALYDIGTGEYIKTIDFLKITEAYPEYLPAGPIEPVFVDGKEHFLIRMGPKDPEVYIREGYKTYKFLLLDVDTEKASLLEPDVGWSYLAGNEIDETFKSQIESWAKQRGIMKESGNECYISSYSNKQGYVEMHMSTEKLPEEELRLYTVFPELEQYKGKSGYTIDLIARTEDMRKLLLE